MAASVRFRPQSKDLGMVMREVDEDLAIFLGIQNGDLEGNDLFLVQDSHDYDLSLDVTQDADSWLTSNTLSMVTTQSTADADFLDLEIDKSNHAMYGLLTTDDASLPPLVEAGMQDPLVRQTEISDAVKFETETGAESSADVNNRPLSSRHGKSTHKLATQTGQQTLKAKMKPSQSSAPNSRATLPSTTKPKTPQERTSKPATTKSASRSSTPTRKPSTTASTKPSTYSSNGSSSGSTKNAPKKTKNLVLGSLDSAPQDLKKSVPKRPVSACRGRPSKPTTLSNEKPRRKSCSPLRAPASNNASYKMMNSAIISRTRGHGNNGGDNVNPVLMGTKMVERVVNMRKLAPPKQDELPSHENSRKSAQENSGFGLSLSKKSLAMAIRHMDITRSISDNLRSVSNGARSGMAKNNATRGRSSLNGSEIEGREIVSERGPSPSTSSDLAGSCLSSDCLMSTKNHRCNMKFSNKS